MYRQRGQELPRAIIDGRQNPEPAPIGELIRHDFTRLAVDSSLLCLRASPLLPQIVEHRIRQKPLQFRVLFLQRLQPLGFGHVHAAQFGFHS